MTRRDEKATRPEIAAAMDLYANLPTIKTESRDCWEMTEKIAAIVRASLREHYGPMLRGILLNGHPDDHNRDGCDCTGCVIRAELAEMEGEE